MVAPRTAVQQFVKASAAALDVVRRPDAGVVVLIYHRVGGGSRLDVDLPVPVFEDQMAWLAESGRAISLASAIEGLRASAGHQFEATTKVVVTFDDGTADFADRAMPILERYRIPVTLYVATAFIEEGIPFPADGDPCSWAALRDVHTTGLVNVGSHTHRHVLLDRLPPLEVETELDRSIGLITDRLGTPPVDFAYPKALLGSPAAERAVRTRFRSAAVAGTRPNRYGTADLYRLARTPIQVSDHHRWFLHKAAGGMALEDRLRQLLNRRRYASGTT
jgi:peptidoglycan/xylan/chitin deacetylase (PgdA/CDA1 family)